MKYTQIPTDTFETLQMNAGIMVDEFNPATGEIGNILGATSGGISFNATPTFSDFGEDIDNCPKNTMELKHLDEWEVVMSGTYATVTAALAGKLVAASDVSGTKVTPRNDLQASDFEDVWWVGDYSNYNGETNGGFCAIHLINALSTGGFQIQTADKGKGQFAFELTGHYSIEEQDKVPFEIYVKDGEAEPTSGTTGTT